jgi:hypothetical protein
MSKRIVPSAPDIPAADKAASDVDEANNKLFADAYRRGLRIVGGKRVVSYSLDFLFGDD